MFVFDIESDGLLIGKDKITKVHCINAIDRRTGREYRFTDHEYYQDVEGNTTDVPCPRDGDIRACLKMMQYHAECLGGHNIIGYDIPALRIVYPDFEFDSEIPRYDSSIAGKCLYPNLKDKDWANKRKGKLPENFYAGDNSLRGWALRAGGVQKKDFNPKDYGHTWKTMPFIQDMDDYCMDDVRANVDVIVMQEGAAGYSQDALDLEFAVAEIISLQERTGVRFDVEAADKFAAELYVELHELENEARNAFPPFYKKDPEAAQQDRRLPPRCDGHQDQADRLQPRLPPADREPTATQVRLGADRVHRHRPSEDRRGDSRSHPIPRGTHDSEVHDGAEAVVSAGRRQDGMDQSGQGERQDTRTG
jgi:hypothetical protein